MAKDVLKLAVIGGDGIGPEVVGTSLDVLKQLAPSEGLAYETTDFPFSAKHFLETGHILDDADVATLREFDAIFLGPWAGCRTIRGWRAE